MKKRLTLIFIIATMTISFIGCGTQEASNDVDNTTTSNSTTTKDSEAQAITETEDVTESVASNDNSYDEVIELQVFAAASLTESLDEISTLYKEIAPNVELIFNLDSSGTLQTQIESGAEADIFISAATKQMTALDDGGYIASDSIVNLLENKVVLIVPEGSDKGITSFKDCASDKVSLIALGNSDVPVGQYSEEIFTNLGVWEDLQSKISFGTNVKEVLSQVEQDTVDCGVVYSTDANTASGIEIVCESTEDSHKPVIYPVGILKASTHQDEAQEFIDYLSNDDATEVFENVGFKMVE